MAAISNLYASKSSGNIKTNCHHEVIASQTKVQLISEIAALNNEVKSLTTIINLLSEELKAAHADEERYMRLCDQTAQITNSSSHFPTCPNCVLRSSKPREATRSPMNAVNSPTPFHIESKAKCAVPPSNRYAPLSSYSGLPEDESPFLWPTLANSTPIYELPKAE